MSTMPIPFSEKIFEQVEQGRKGSGGISDRVVVFQGLRYQTIEVGMSLCMPSGGKLRAHYMQGEAPSGVSVLFKRHGEKEDHLSFVVLDENDEVMATSQDGTTGYIYAAFTREKSQKIFALAMIATMEGENRTSDMLLCDDQRTAMFLRSVGGIMP